MVFAPSPEDSLHSAMTAGMTTRNKRCHSFDTGRGATDKNVMNQTHLTAHTFPKMFTPFFLPHLVTKTKTKRFLMEKLKQRKLCGNNLPNRCWFWDAHRNNKQENEGACTNAPEDVSSLDPSTSSLSSVLFSAPGTKFPSCLSAKVI